MSKPKAIGDRQSILIDQLSFTVRATKFRLATTLMKRTIIPLATEFALRLIRLVPGVTAEDLAAFFGFREAEIAVLVQDMLETGLVLDRDGRFELSVKGLEAVSPLGDVELFATEEVTAQIVLDLIAFAPIEEAELDKALTKCVPDLPLPDRQRAANALSEAPGAFEYHFQEWAQRFRKRSDDMRFRSVEDVQQIRSLSVPIAIPINYRLDEPSQTEADFSALRQVGVPNSRNPLIASLSSEIQRVVGSNEADWAFETLSNIDGGILNRLGLDDLSGISTWIRSIVGADTSDNHAGTIPIFGSVVGDRARENLVEWVTSLSSQASGPLFWLPPQLDHWGRSVAFDSLIRELRGVLRDGITLLMRTDNSEQDRRRIVRYFGSTGEQVRFDRCIGTKISTLGSLEIIVQPGAFVMALVHSPDPRTGYPLPVGYLSTEASVVKEFAYYLGGLLHDLEASSVIWHRTTESREHAFDEITHTLY
jgi:hypothetical protein